jgi:excisionase family DNA binding protein
MRTPKTTTDRLLGAESAAELLEVRPSTIRWWWTTGKLQRVKIGRLTRVWESDVLALVSGDRKWQINSSTSQQQPKSRA